MRSGLFNDEAKRMLDEGDPLSSCLGRLRMASQSWQARNLHVYKDCFALVRALLEPALRTAGFFYRDACGSSAVAPEASATALGSWLVGQAVKVSHA